MNHSLGSGFLRYSIEADLISTFPLSSSVNGLPSESHFLANALISSVLAGGFDGDGVFAAGELFSVIVLAVPDDLVLAGRRGSGGRR